MERYKSVFPLLLRISIGWYFLYEGITKLLTPGWSSEAYLKESFGFLSEIFHLLASNPHVIKVVNIFNIWGMILIGVGLFLGILIRVSAVSGMVLLLLYYMAYPPFELSSLDFTREGNYWIVNRNLIECIALGLIFFYPVMDFSILNFFRRYRDSVKDGSIINLKNGDKRRALIKGLVALPFLEELCMLQ